MADKKEVIAVCSCGARFFELADDIIEMRIHVTSVTHRWTYLSNKDSQIYIQSDFKPVK